MIKLIYTAFLGLLLATFVGVGLAVFFPGPTMPETPAVMERGPVKSEMTDKEKAESDAYIVANRQFQQDFKQYSRNISLASITLAIIILVIGLVLIKQLGFLADGVVLGGVFTLAYGIIRGFMTEDNLYRFIAVTAGLVVTLVLGYLKFVKPAKRESI